MNEQLNIEQIRLEIRKVMADTVKLGAANRRVAERQWQNDERWLPFMAVLAVVAGLVVGYLVGR